LAKLIKKIDKDLSTFDFIKEKGFTLKSLGLLVFILGLPNESVFSLDDLSYQFSDGITSIRNAVSELEKLGESAFDFSEAVKQFFAKNKVRKEIRKIILKAMEK
jgi:hypothetical protein